MITSPDNDKLKLIRKLRERKHREREGLFASEGEDLVEAGLAAGLEPVIRLAAAGSGLEGEEVEPALLDSISALGSGTRTIAVWQRAWAEGPPPVAVYLHGVADPGNVGAVIRSADALLGATVVVGPESADPFGPRAVRASMGSIFAMPPAQIPLELTPAPRVALLAHGGEATEALSGARTLCVGAERAGLPPQVTELCEVAVTIPLRPGAESLNLAAAAAIACERISSPALRETGGSGGGRVPQESADA